MSLLHAEYLKVTRRKLYPVMVAILALAMLLIGAFFYLAIPAIPESAGGGGVVPQRPEAFIFGAQQVAGQAWWFAVILAATILGGEVGSTVWATGLTRESGRLNHASSRFLVFTIASWLGFLLGVLMWAGSTWLWADGTGVPEMSVWLGLLWKFIFIAGAWTSIGLAAVAVSRSLGIAIGVALAISFIDGIVAPFVEAYESVSLSAATNGIFDVGGDSPFSTFVPGGEMSLTHALLVMVGWMLAGLILTWWGLQRRDA